MDLSILTKEELSNQLYKEAIYYSEELNVLCKILCRNLPRRMIYRIISKLYRLRK